MNLTTDLPGLNSKFKPSWSNIVKFHAALDNKKLQINTVCGEHGQDSYTCNLSKNLQAYFNGNG